MSTTTQGTADLGSDVSCQAVNQDGVADLDPSFAVITGARVVAEVVVRRWQTPHGMLPDDPDCGEDITDILSSRMTMQRAFALQFALENEAKKDERVDTINVVVTQNVAAKSLKITAYGATAAGPTFSIVLSVTQLTQTVLFPT